MLKLNLSLLMALAQQDTYGKIQNKNQNTLASEGWFQESQKQIREREDR